MNICEYLLYDIYIRGKTSIRETSAERWFDFSMAETRNDRGFSNRTLHPAVPVSKAC